MSVQAPEADIAASVPAGASTLRGLVLLVDDEDIVRASTADMLLELGYEVVEAGSGEEAMAFAAQGTVPDLLVTDHLMSGMSGVDLAFSLRDSFPNLPVLVISGYANVEDLSAELPRLTKPFKSSDLAASLAQISFAAPA